MLEFHDTMSQIRVLPEDFGRCWQLRRWAGVRGPEERGVVKILFYDGDVGQTGNVNRRLHAGLLRHDVDLARGAGVSGCQKQRVTVNCVLIGQLHMLIVAL